MALALPIMLSNFIQTFYNLIDAFWLGKLHENARAAVSAAGIAYPLILFLSSFGFGFVVAGTALVARFKGAGDMHNIRRTIGQYVNVLILFSTVIIIVGLFCIDIILQLLNTPPDVYAAARIYVQITFLGTVFMFVFLFYQSIAHGLGDSFNPMIIQLVSVGFNLIIDPLLIFGIGFFPRMEIRGAAFASFASRGIAAILALLVLKRKYSDVLPTLSDIRPNYSLIKTILRIGLPASIGQSVTSFGFVFLQSFVNSYGSAVISIFSIGNRMNGIFMMPAMGISSALSAFIGQNLGCGNVSRAEKGFQMAMLLCFIIMAVGCTSMYFFGAQLTVFFINDPQVLEIGIRMFKVSALASFLFGISYVFSGVFNGSGYTKASMIINIGRLWALRIPMVYLFSGLFLDKYIFNSDYIMQFLKYFAQPLAQYPYDALWWSMVFSNGIAALVGFAVYKAGTWKQVKIMF